MNRRIFIWIWLGLVAIGGYLIMNAPLVPQWGHYHAPQSRSRWQRLLAGETAQQTFRLEYAKADAFVFWVDKGHELPSDGGVEVEIEVAGRSRRTWLPYANILADGLAAVQLNPAIEGRVGEAALVRLRLPQSGQAIFLQFQNDGTIYPDGELTHSARYTEGDLAFQLHYQRPPFGLRRWHFLYAALFWLAGMGATWVWWRFPNSRLSIKRPDVLMAIGVAVGVTGFYLCWLWGWGGWWVGPGDFVKDVAYITASQDALVAGVWPAWSHVICGGMPLLGNPEGNSLSLGTLLALMMPAEQALWLLLCLEAGIGAAGVYVLGRMWGLSRLASTLAAIIAVGCAAYPYRIVEGFSMIGGAVAFMPWVLVGCWQSLKTPHIKYVALAGLSLAFIFWRGEIHILTALLLCLGVWAIVAVVRQGRSALLVVAGVACIFFVAASPKLLAFLEEPQFFSQHYQPYVARLVQDGLLQDVLLTTHGRFYPIDVRHGRSSEEWANFGAYVGVLPLLLAAYGLRVRRGEKWLVIGGLLLSFILAEGTVFDVWLRHVGPLSGLLRLPVRGLALTMIWLGLLAGSGLDGIRRFFPASGLWLVIGVALVVAVDLAAADGRVFAETVWPRTQLVLPRPASPTLAQHDNGSPGGVAHAGTLLRSGYLLPHVCADILSQPEFAKHMPATLSLSSTPVVLTPNHMRLLPVNPASGYEILARFDSAWVSPQAWILKGGQGQMRVVPFQAGHEPIDVSYVQGLSRAEQFGLCLVFVFMVGMILF